MNKSFKYRLYPNNQQQILLKKTFGCCRFIYNKMLADKIAYYQETKQVLKNTPAQYKSEFEWLKEVDSLALANEQMHLQSAYLNFFRNPKIGFPKYKSKKFDNKSYTTNNVNNSIKVVSSNHIQIPKLGVIRFVEHRRIPKDYIIKSATISQSTSGRFYISVLTEFDYEIPNIDLDKSKSIGLDYSSHDFYVDNQNRSPENFQHLYRNSQSKLAKEQRKLSRMKLHSANYEKQKVKVAKIHEKIKNQRKDFIEKESMKLANLYDIVCVEDINLQNIAQSLRLGKSTNDNGFGMFKTRLQQKLEYQGKKLVKIDKWFPSSKICRFCGCINSELKLSDRMWTCGCGQLISRDENAAINILNEGLRLLYSQ